MFGLHKGFFTPSNVAICKGTFCPDDAVLTDNRVPPGAYVHGANFLYLISVETVGC